MNKEIEVKNKSLVSPIEVKTKRFMVKNSSYNPDKILQKFSKDMNKAQEVGFSDDLCRDYVKVTNMLGLSNHIPISESLPETYRELNVKIINDIEKEYECNSTIEKIMAENIGNLHVRIIFLTKILNDLIQNEKMPVNERTNFYNLVGKDIERTHRQLNQWISTLQLSKNAGGSIKVSAKTTFIANNQQFNNLK
jgi:uncharacterized protein (UPF0147 family)